ncbi:hypothetical protein BS78_09G086200 [Paspalum vaginatum]|nr:hypothetical protein BS78_09G086200 [Paspalum vaginatum]
MNNVFSRHLLRSKRKVGNIKIQLSMAKEILHRIEIARDHWAPSNGEEWLRKNTTYWSLEACIPEEEKQQSDSESGSLHSRRGEAAE